MSNKKPRELPKLYKGKKWNEPKLHNVELLDDSKTLAEIVRDVRDLHGTGLFSDKELIRHWEHNVNRTDKSISVIQNESQKSNAQVYLVNESLANQLGIKPDSKKAHINVKKYGNEDGKEYAIVVNEEVLDHNSDDYHFVLGLLESYAKTPSFSDLNSPQKHLIDGLLKEEGRITEEEARGSIDDLLDYYPPDTKIPQNAGDIKYDEALPALEAIGYEFVQQIGHDVKLKYDGDTIMLNGSGKTTDKSDIYRRIRNAVDLDIEAERLDESRREEAIKFYKSLIFD